MSASTFFEDFKGLSSDRWKAVESFPELTNSLSAGDMVQYTRDSYVPRAEFLKRLTASKDQGITVEEFKNRMPNKGRKKCMCVVDEVDYTGDSVVVKVKSMPRKFKQDDKEHKTMSWTLKDGMRGAPKYYIRIPKEQ